MKSTVFIIIGHYIPNNTHARFSVIIKNDFPKESQDINYQKMIYKEFETELAKLKCIKEGTNKIQSETKNHKFDRGNNSKQISALENKL